MGVSPSLNGVCLDCPSAERPLRGYELLSDVQASWNKDKLVNMFVLKWTPLAASLSLEVRWLFLLSDRL